MKPGIKERYSGRILDEAFVACSADDAGGTFTATMFNKALGGRARDNGGWNSDRLHEYGRTIGLMHRVSKSYGLRAGIVARPMWDAQRRSTERDASVQEKLSSARAAIHTLGTNPSNYHMIHQDPHLGNLHVDTAGSITLFDFAVGA